MSCNTSTRFKVLAKEICSHATAEKALHEEEKPKQLTRENAIWCSIGVLQRSGATVTGLWKQNHVQLVASSLGLVRIFQCRRSVEDQSACLRVSVTAVVSQTLELKPVTRLAVGELSRDIAALDDGLAVFL